MARPRWAIVATLALCLGTAARGSALETDQYIAWGHELEDAAPALNAWFNRELALAVAGHDRADQCSSLAASYQRRLRFLYIIHPPELWASTTPLVDRYPATSADELSFPDENLYRTHGLLDIGLWMPITATIQVGGVRIGTDKLSHFVSLGWQLYAKYRRLVRRGRSPEEAAERAVRSGLNGERYLLLGYRTSGILSLSDLEADVQGLKFYRDLCEGDAPVLERSASGWRIAHPIDLRRYVTPEWDESYQPQVFRKGRWKKVLPVVKKYCRWLDNPWLIAERQEYAGRDGLTESEVAIQHMVADGKIPDPLEFSLEAVCGRTPRPLDGGVRAPPSPQPVPRKLETGLGKAVARDEATKVRRTLGLWRAGYSGPLGASGAVGLMAARSLPENPCHVLCDFRGPYAQLGAGRGGARLSFGYGRLWADLGRRGRFLRHAYMGLGVRGTILRTWGDPIGAPSAGTYVGPELELSIARVNLTLGALRRMSGSDSRSWIATWGLGFGF